MKKDGGWWVAVLPVGLVVLGSFFLQVTVLSDVEGVRVWLSSFGAWFILVYILVQTITIVIAPIVGRLSGCRWWRLWGRREG